MSEPKLISPLLDGFAMGTPISEHNGIRCCPAIKENTDKKYIVKIIAIPASQAQMDALLLAGAYKDPSGAMEYFRDKGEEVLKEAELLKKLSKLEGFLSYEGCQMEPITRHRLGYEVYLVGSYKRSLDKYIRHHAMTHLEAINLGLDICGALSVCRQAGALYVDLKPSNIFMSDKKEYRIGDLGFIEMDALRYTALPDKYQSSYTPPELYDPMASVNMTVDTYALGMILYQLYNDGNLPFRGKAPEQALPSPVQADYELAEIIMKAIHPDPEQRWTDPAEMGKALASYMQRNTVNDVAITPLQIQKKSRKTKKQKMSRPAETVEADAETAAEIPSEVLPEPEAMAEPIVPAAIPEESSASEETAAKENPVEEAVPVAEAVIEESAETGKGIEAQTGGYNSEVIPEEEDVSEEEEIPEEEDISEDEETPEEEDISEDEETPEEEDFSEEENPGDKEPSEQDDEPGEPFELSDELSRIIAKADDLIAHETPEGVVVPEIPDLPDPFAFATEDEEIDDSDIPYDPLMEDETEPENKTKKKSEKKFENPKYKRRKKRFVSALITLLILMLIGSGAFWYYQNLFLQTIDGLTITGDREQITVEVDTQIDESLLTVSCLDNYGEAKTVSLSGGKAVFTGLRPNTMYTIRLEIDGFHSLVGKTSDIFTTDTTTSIIAFTSIAGSEDGSVILNFTVDGDEPEEWSVVYTAEGEEEKRETFTGHSVSISGLSLGKLYTFTLDAGESLSLSGNKTLELMASRLILAANLNVTSTGGSDITVHWDTPGDVIVDSWDVRCYNDTGYDQQVTVLENEVMFTGIDPSVEYTVEVTAAGMTQPARTGITANPININTLNVDESADDQLKLTWEFTGNKPEGGWLLMYTIDGSENHVIKTDKASASVSPKIPGAKYVFSIQAADGTSIFSNVHTFTVADAQPFEGNALSTDMLTIDLLKTPEDDNWYFENISDDQLTDQFVVGDSISIALRSSDSFYLPGYEVNVLYVIRDTYGNVLAKHVTADTVIWKSIWTGGDAKNGELDVPSVPDSAGSYVLSLYFNGMSVADIPFTITE